MTKYQKTKIENALVEMVVKVAETKTALPREIPASDVSAINETVRVLIDLTCCSVKD